MSQPATSPSSTRSILKRFIDTAGRSLGVSRVFGEAIETPAGSVIPVAVIVGGQGIGFGNGVVGRRSADDITLGTEAEQADGDSTESGSGSGGGGGFGVAQWPAGAYVTTNGETRWQPSLDPNVVVIAGAALASCIVAGLTTVAVARAVGGTVSSLAHSGSEAATTMVDGVTQAWATAVTAGASAASSIAGSAAGTTVALADRALQMGTTMVGTSASSTMKLAELASGTVTSLLGKPRS